jgi:formate dehydrogenase subunit gamma
VQADAGTTGEGTVEAGTEALAGLIEGYRELPGGLLPLLHAIQKGLGYVPPAAVPEIAAALSLSRAEVHGVISFYHDFRTGPAGRRTVQICRAEACQSVGARSLERHVVNVLGVPLGETTADGAITLQGVYCLGNCACGPSVRIDDRVYGRVDADRLERLLADCRAGVTDR